jgi:2-dehydro-3-deoxyphosphogluconate aldolase/(4S)-4-hydroxy-2-oxoglutarate aldolase
VRTLEALDVAARAEAAFIVGPTLDRAIVDGALERGLPVIPGAYSPTEIAHAWEHGATFVKLFPASSLGPAHVRELHGPLPAIELIATGGVDAASARGFLDAGCVAVGVGSALVRADAVERRAIVAAASGAT